MPFTTVETYSGGVLVESRQVFVEQAVVNRDAMMAKAKQALTANTTYLASPQLVASPTNPQVIAHVRANDAQIRLLTRQTNALIRLMLGDLADVSDT